VGDRILTTEDVAQVNGQLGRYAQSRFTGEEGRALLTSALVDTEVLAQAARDGGLDGDPRVQWAIVEEMASLALAAELERRVPASVIANDRSRLREYYDTHPEEFLTPERRNLQGVRFTDLGEADAAHEQVATGAATLESFGDLLTTRLAARDDGQFPGAHPLLFDDQLEAGDLLASPVVLGRNILVARLHEVEPAMPRPFDDATVQAEIVEAVRRPLVEAARAEYLAELEARYGAPARP